MLPEQTEVVQVVAVQDIQTGTQAVADDGQNTSTGRRRPRGCGVLGC